MRHLFGMLVLLVNAPALLLRRQGLEVPGLLSGSMALGGIFVTVGLLLVSTTIWLLARVGRGTLAPWSPTERLVVPGPYRWVRNPMISEVLVVLLREALLFRSLAGPLLLRRRALHAPRRRARPGGPLR